MKTLTNFIILYRFNGSSGQYIDVETDISTLYGVVTWRREGQDEVEGAVHVHTFPVSDIEQDNTAGLVEVLVDLSHGTMKESDAQKEVELLFKRIRNEIPTGSGWGHRHSKRHAELVKRNKQLEANYAAGIMEDWEVELLHSGSNN